MIHICYCSKFMNVVGSFKMAWALYLTRSGTPSSKPELTAEAEEIVKKIWKKWSARPQLIFRAAAISFSISQQFSITMHSLNNLSRLNSIKLKKDFNLLLISSTKFMMLNDKASADKIITMNCTNNKYSKHCGTVLNNGIKPTIRC